MTVAKTTQAKPKAPAREPAKKRVRLTPDIRRQQILDAALVEFTALGFNAASISKIASRAGTSKANLYVHFANKDEIFETLLRQVLPPAMGGGLPSESGQELDEWIDAFIDASYQLSPDAIAVIRLVISESHRIPKLIQRWYEETIMPARAARSELVQNLVDSGKARPGPLTENFNFSMAPILYAAVVQMLFSQQIAANEVQAIKETHRELLHLMLSPGHKKRRVSVKS